MLVEDFVDVALQSKDLLSFLVLLDVFLLETNCISHVSNNNDNFVDAVDLGLILF